MLAAGVWFVVLYPNIAALPLPDTIVNAYQGLLPTYLYAFQFSVNTLDRSGAISFADARSCCCVVFLAVACAVVAYSTWVWRMAPSRRTSPRPGDTGGPEGRRARPERGLADRAVSRGGRGEPRTRRGRTRRQATSTGASSRTTGTPAAVRGEGGTVGGEVLAAGRPSRPGGGSRTRSSPRPWRSPAAS